MFAAGARVVAVDASRSVSRTTARDRLSLNDGLTLLDRRMRGVFVVLADDQKRKPIQRREVEYLVGDALVEHAVADDGNADVVAAPVLLSKRAAERHVERASDDRAAVEIVVVRARAPSSRQCRDWRPVFLP